MASAMVGLHISGAATSSFRLDAATHFGAARPLVSANRGRRFRLRPPLGDSLQMIPGIVCRFPAIGAGDQPARGARENHECEESERYCVNDGNVDSVNEPWRPVVVWPGARWASTCSVPVKRA